VADIGASGVTYTILNQRKLGDSRNLNRVRLAFGNASDTVPANGIPITKGKMGCPTIIESMVVVDQGTSGYVFQYDQSAEKLVVMQAPAQTHTHNMFLLGGLTLDAAIGLNGTTNFGKNVATNVTINSSNTSTNGGINSTTLAAASLAEASAVAIAAQTIEVEVIGW